jgi:archaeal flagellar protein FlaJ
MNWKKTLERIFGRTRRTRELVMSSMLAGFALIVLNFAMFISNSQVFTTLNLLAVIIIMGPSLYMMYRDYAYSKEVEEKFPDFLRDITEGLSAGMTLPQAIKNTKRNDYGALTSESRKMAMQIEWGVPFEEILIKFGEHSGSSAMKRTVSTIIETHRSGGNIASVLEAVAKSVSEIDKIKQERTSHIFAQMLTGYTIFFIFLGVMIGLQRFLIPNMVGGAGIGELSAAPTNTEELAAIYKDLFGRLIIIQGLFSGAAIGKMSEGSILAGLRHSLALVAIGYTAFLLGAE